MKFRYTSIDSHLHGSMVDCLLIRLKSHSGCSVDYVKKFGEIEYSQFRYELWEQYKDIWKAYLEIKKQTDERAIRIKGNEEVICGNSAIFDAEVEQAEHFCLPIIWQRRRGKWVEIIDPTLEKYSGSTNTPDSKLILAQRWPDVIIYVGPDVGK